MRETLRRWLNETGNLATKEGVRRVRLANNLKALRGIVWVILELWQHTGKYL
jgi:hypothetical protein